VDLPSTAVNNFINPFFIVIFSPIFAMLWIWLAKRRQEPSTPMKFGLAFLQLGLGFYVFVLGANAAGNDGLVALSWFALGYLFISTGELCLSPIGLSMVTKLSPGKSVGLVMGFWFLASALGQYVAGLVGALMAIPSEEGQASLPASESLMVYSGVFEKITLVSIGAGIIVIILTPLIRKWMRGIH
jgi:POT family proton-dependent oligopeptide transporter